MNKMVNKKVVWVTDVHLNFLRDEDGEAFVRKIHGESPDVLLVGGDIGEAPSVCRYLLDLERTVECPIYFVLGNHDYYRGSLSEVNENVRRIVSFSNKLFFLDDVPPVKLTDEVALVGHGSWADGRLGDYNRSHVMLNDHVLINEFIGLDKDQRFRKLNELGDAAASQIEKKLIAAFNKYRKVVCLTHVPPFRESCWYEGQISDDNYLPHFSCKAVGDAMRNVMQTRPESNLIVLCGHTHGSGKTRLLKNLEVITGSADYGKPEIQKVIYL